MDQDKKRIGVGNNKFPAIGEVEVPEPVLVFTFDSEEITFDSILSTFDEEI